MDESDKISHREKMMKLGHDIYKKFFSDMAKQCGSHFTQIFEAIKFLPKEELGIMAESLVNLVSFRKRMSLEAETVGGPCDVAVISKGDGFIWVKRKHYFRKDLNPQFIRNYFQGLEERSDEGNGGI